VKRRIAINGFGRIGRMVARLALESHSLDLVAVNDLVPSDNLAYLFKYDTVHRTYPGEVTSAADALIVEGKRIAISAEKDPTRLPWKRHGIDYVIESTGRFTHLEDAKKHLAAGAKRVLISAPGKEEIPTYVMGVNHLHYQPNKDFIICNA
jgi:glyceraldehyde 3-phosphate dehydrogenase